MGPEPFVGVSCVQVKEYSKYGTTKHGWMQKADDMPKHKPTGEKKICGKG